MALVIPYEQFLLRRVAEEQARAAAALKSLAAKTQQWQQSLEECCDTARIIVEDAIARSETAKTEIRSEQERTERAFAGNLDDMIAERDRLAARIASAARAARNLS